MSEGDSSALFIKLGVVMIKRFEMLLKLEGRVDLVEVSPCALAPINTWKGKESLLGAYFRKRN